MRISTPAVLASITCAVALILVRDSSAPRAEDNPDPAIVRRWTEALAAGDAASLRDSLPNDRDRGRILNVLMASPDPRVRKGAIDFAWSLKDLGEVVPGLTLLLRDADLGNRWTAAHLLGKTGAAAGNGATAELLRCMLEPSSRTQVPATHSIGQLGDVSRDALVQTLREPSVLLAARAFDKLSGPGIVIQGGDNAAVNALVHALHSSPDAPIRRQAARVMKRLLLLGPKEEAELLRAALDDDTPDVRIAASTALAETPAERHADILRALREGRHDPDPAARVAIVEALRKLGASEEELK
ncbi:MAG: HEAT repeat domain-containing protein [Planctomycetes bacterium]|nr:HEAT repeat domain-containing protein [Planctomycetota bacterium]